MRLYTKTGATQVDDPEYGIFTANADGAFDGLPDGMYTKLHGRPGWENDAERERRITTEELDRFRDPAELLKAVRELGANQGVLASAIATALGLTQQSAAQADPPTPVQDAVPTDTPESSAEDEGEPSTESSESSAGESETPDPAATSAPAKATSGRGRGAKAAKTAAS